MPDELVDIVTENNKLTGEQKLKSIVHADGSWHRVTHDWIYNSKGEVLLQLRAKNKFLYPDKWDLSASGHIVSGEDPASSACREIEEEVGIEVQKDNLFLYKIFKADPLYKDMASNNNEFYYIYFYRYDGEIKNLKIQTAEVAEIKFVPLDQIKADYQKNPDKFTPNPKYWFEVLDALASHNLSSK